MSESGNQQGVTGPRLKLSKILFDIRLEEVQTISRHGVAASLSNIFNASLIVIISWSEELMYSLLVWWGAAILVFSTVLLNSIRSRKNIDSFSVRELAIGSVFFSMLSALPWPFLAYITLGQDNVVVTVSVLLMCVGLTSGGSIITYRVPLAAITYLLTILWGTTSVIILNSYSQLWPITIILIALSLLMIRAITAAWYIARNREENMKLAWSQNQKLQLHNEEVERISRLDILTGLYNRKAFIEYFEKKVSQAGEKKLAVLLLDLDRFKHINDSLGHRTGDALLKVIGKRLRNAVAETDLIARFGGDEFALAATIDHYTPSAVSIAERIIKVLNQPVTIESSVIHPNASIGIAFYPDHTDLPEKLLDLADIALHQAKENGRGCFEIYNDEMAVSLSRNDEIEIIINDAIKNNTLNIFYQPKFSLRTGKIVGTEALLRCYRNQEQFIPTSELLKVAQERGLIPLLSNYILSRITSDILAWKSEDIEAMPVAINIHAFDLKSPDLLISNLKQALAAGITHEDIILEVTESSFVGRGADAAYVTLDMINDMGIQFSLDDFGTGHAALSLLKHIPIRELKIDREFIHGICNDDRDLAIASATLEITKRLKIDCVAEGIETLEQLNFLKNLNNESVNILGQGHYWADAMSMKDFTEFYRTSVSGKLPVNISK